MNRLSFLLLCGTVGVGGVAFAACGGSSFTSAAQDAGGSADSGGNGGGGSGSSSGGGSSSGSGGSSGGGSGSSSGGGSGSSSGGESSGGSSSGAGGSSSGSSGGSSGGGSGSGSGGGSSSGSGSGGSSSGGTPNLVTEPDQGLTPIYDLIGTATKTLDMTMYELTDTTVTGLLTAAAKKGVTVRVILDQNLEKSSNTTAYNALSSGGVSVHWADATYAATHQKTITIDSTTSAIMTLNLTPEYYTTSRDFAVITTDPADVAAIETTFAADFASTAITPPTGTDLVWSPTNAQSSMTAVIAGATTSLVVENEEMSDTAIVSALAAAATRGVSVEVVMTASSSYDSEFTTLKNAGVKVVTYAANAALYIHAKVILADAGTAAATAFLGSENFSSASLTKNRELGLVTSNAAILAAVGATLASDFKGATAY